MTLKMREISDALMQRSLYHLAIAERYQQAAMILRQNDEQSSVPAKKRGRPSKKGA